MVADPPSVVEHVFDRVAVGEDTGEIRYRYFQRPPLPARSGQDRWADEDVAGGGTAAGTGATRLTRIAPRLPAICSNCKPWRASAVAVNAR